MGAIRQKSKTPAAIGTSPTTMTIIPVPECMDHPQKMSAAPTMMRIQRPAADAMKLAKREVLIAMI